VETKADLRPVLAELHRHGLLLKQRALATLKSSFEFKVRFHDGRGLFGRATRFRRSPAP
jgi:hypothetical protein